MRPMQPAESPHLSEPPTKRGSLHTLARLPLFGELGQSAFWPVSSRSIQPPSESQPDQLPLGAVCHLCHSALSAPRAKTSNRPSLFWFTFNSSIQPPSESQSDQLPLGAVCHLCHSALSAPRAKTSSRPSALRPVSS